MSRVRHAVSAAVAASVLLAASSCFAAEQSGLSDRLQQDALTCVGEAVQICPEVLTSDDHGLACMTGKRAQFSPRCRVIYDKVARSLRR